MPTKLQSLKTSLSLRRLVEALTRFPLPVLAAALTCGAIIASSHITGINTDVFRDRLAHLAAAAGAAFPFLILAPLLIERRCFEKWQRNIVQALPLVGAIAFFAWMELQRVDLFGQERLLIICVLTFVLGTLALFLVPWTRTDQEEGSLWTHGKQLVEAFVLAMLIGVIVFIGIQLASEAIRSLFDLNRIYTFTDDLAIFCFTFLAPCIFLAGIPTKDASASSEYSSWLRVIAKFVLPPLLGVYLLILATYAGKILFTWELPKDTVVAWIVLYAALAIIISVLTHPLRQKTEKRNALRVIHAVSFIAMVPFLLLYAISIWTRVAEYGVTINRYAIVLFGFWLIGWTAYELVTLKSRERLSPLFASAIVVLAIGLYSPVNAYAISFHDQFARFTQNLQTAGALKDRVLQKTVAQDVDQKLLTDIQSETFYLFGKHGEKAVAKAFGKTNEEILNPIAAKESYDKPGAFMTLVFGFGWENRTLNDKWGYARQPSYDNGFISLNRQDQHLNVVGFDAAYPAYLNELRETPLSDGLTAQVTGSSITLKKNGQGLITADMQKNWEALAEAKMNARTSEATTEEMTFRAENEKIKIAVILNYANFTGPNPWKLTGGDGWLVVKMK